MPKASAISRSNWVARITSPSRLRAINSQTPASTSAAAPITASL